MFWRAGGGIRDSVASRGLGDVYKIKIHRNQFVNLDIKFENFIVCKKPYHLTLIDFGASHPLQTGLAELQMSSGTLGYTCLLYTFDAADDRLCDDIGGLRNINNKTTDFFFFLLSV